MYAVVDIETTGGYAAANGITEIAIAIHDGLQVLEYYETLINPQKPIPFFIQKLTGITDDMVHNAPTFEEVAPRIFELLQGNTFVAHNVNFDYSFVNKALYDAGYTLRCTKLCTVRAARKVIPHYPSYSLGKLTHALGITHSNKHRAGGDTLATADLLAHLLREDVLGHIPKMIYGKSREHFLPPHIPTDDVRSLPHHPGVYYFHNAQGKVVYIGKAIDLKKRVSSHFSNNKSGRTKQQFLKEVTRISYTSCGTELLASILESAEIRSKWPVYNRSQRGFLPSFGLVHFIDRVGRARLAIEKVRPGTMALTTFNTLTEATSLLHELVEEFQLCPALSSLCKPNACNKYVHTACADGCEGKDVDAHNRKIVIVLQWLEKRLPTFVFMDKGRTDQEQSFILVKKGQLKGIGYLEGKSKKPSLKNLESALEPLQGNDFMRNLVYKNASMYPEKIMYLD